MIIGTIPMKNQLPEPLDALKAQSQILKKILQEKISKQGFISFAEYMHHCLYTPTLGYYSQANIELGASGDFITAPLISSRFSDCIAKRAFALFQQGLPKIILEVGAGVGKMAADILAYFEKNSLEMPRYMILEVSADLRKQQKAMIERIVPQALEYVIWIDNFPSHFSGMIVANELLDAMPIHLFTYEKGLFLENIVTLDAQGDFILEKKDILPASAKTYLHTIEPAINSPYTSEINLAAQGWLTELYKHCDSAVILLIDYGFHQKAYYHPERHRGTLMCHYQHRAHEDVFFYPGLQDITAHVDFTFIAETAFNLGFTIEAYCSQSDFLLTHGILDTCYEDPIEQYELAQGLKRLLLPSEMGELFKVMVLSKAYPHLLDNFCQEDLRNFL